MNAKTKLTEPIIKEEETSAIMRYEERANGNFINYCENQELHKIFEELRTIIKANKKLNNKIL